MSPRRRNEVASFTMRLMRKVVVAVIGIVTILVGIAGLFLPILPGMLLIVAGLAILATEYALARRGLDALRTRFRHLVERFR
jgi:uncharacterized membrane protein YbaN (DUF454 family)